jgi:hypothetical protein
MDSELTYLLPLKAGEDLSSGELNSYLEEISGYSDVLIVDASEESVFERHHRSWERFATHIPVDPGVRCWNGKVRGVLTGLPLVRTPKLVIADDDVRYDRGSLQRVAELLDRYELVRPQNYFDPLPWHARWDTARSLLNRSFGADYPGTLGVATKVLLGTDGYDGDVLFENLEMIRTLEVAGARTTAPLDLYVRRIPPDTSHFVNQRVRQAYDELALPLRMAAFLAVLPTVLTDLRRKRFPRLGARALALVGLAEVGRRRGGGKRYFPPSTSWFAPAWVLERGTCMWLALGRRIFSGGVPYGGVIIRRAANSPRSLRRRLDVDGPAERLGP